MTAKSDQLKQRNSALAGLLAEQLKPAFAGATTAGGLECPDAELMAAYADQGLATHEREQLDAHFADCGRCQKILAVLAVSADAPLGAAEARQLGARTSATSRPAAQRWFWWLAPALGTAAAVMLWFGMQPATTGQRESVQSAADYSATREALPQEIDPLSRAMPQTESAEVRPLAKATEAPAAATGDAAANQPQAAAANDQSLRARAEQSDAAIAAMRDERAQAAERESAGDVSAFSSAPAAARTTAPASPVPSAAEQEARIAAQNNASTPPQAAMQAAAPQPGGGVVFSSPDGSRRWRLDPGGRIEQSSDGGQTWQAQASGVTTDLVAGAAPSSQAAWVVGRGGVILRLTGDAQFPRWQRLAVPAAPTADWAGVEARDASTVTVTATDGRRFTTQNAGGTWVPEQ
jgi:hypothetical protein